MCCLDDDCGDDLERPTRRWLYVRVMTLCASEAQRANEPRGVKYGNDRAGPECVHEPARVVRASQREQVKKKSVNGVPTSVTV